MILNKVKFKLFNLQRILKISKPPVFCLSASQPACVPAIRPASGGRIGSIFSQNEGYNYMHYHRSVVLIEIYMLRHSEHFYPSLILFLFDWLMKR